MNLVGRVVAGCIGGVPIAFTVYMILMMSFNLAHISQTGAGVLLAAGFVFAMILAITASRPGKAWRRMFITIGLLCFSLPIATLLMQTFIYKDIDPGAAAGTAAGVAIGGGLAIGFAAIIGFSIGAVFLIIGLLIARGEGQPRVHSKSRDHRDSPMMR